MVHITRGVGDGGGGGSLATSLRLFTSPTVALRRLTLNP